MNYTWQVVATYNIIPGPDYEKVIIRIECHRIFLLGLVEIFMAPSSWIERISGLVRPVADSEGDEEMSLPNSNMKKRSFLAIFLGYKKRDFSALWMKLWIHPWIRPSQKEVGEIYYFVVYIQQPLIIGDRHF